MRAHGAMMACAGVGDTGAEAARGRNAELRRAELRGAELRWAELGWTDSGHWARVGVGRRAGWAWGGRRPARQRWYMSSRMSKMAKSWRRMRSMSSSVQARFASTATAAAVAACERTAGVGKLLMGIYITNEKGDGKGFFRDGRIFFALGGWGRKGICTTRQRVGETDFLSDSLPLCDSCGSAAAGGWVGGRRWVW